MTEHNRPLAADLAAIIDAQPKECFRSAALALFAYRGDDPAVYVEGLLWIDVGLFIEHGWLEVGGCIVDPTLTDDTAECYHAVFRFSRDDVQGLVHLQKALPYYGITCFGRQRLREAEGALWREVMPNAAV